MWFCGSHHNQFSENQCPEYETKIAKLEEDYETEIVKLMNQRSQ